MNPLVKRQWVQALRSGKYLQGRNRLCQPGKTGLLFCCLGVLCEIAVQNGIINPPIRKESGEVRYDGDMFDLPRSVKFWAGMNNVDVKIDGWFSGSKDRPHTLGSINDAGIGFERIAELIEQQL